MKKKPTNKQILYAHGQSYQLMQEAKRYDDAQRKKEYTTIVLPQFHIALGSRISIKKDGKIITYVVDSITHNIGCTLSADAILESNIELIIIK